MKFLIKLYQLLIRFFQWFKRTSSEVKIPLEIAGDEIIVRGIVHPLFFSKKKLTESAFLPPKENGRKDVSVLRHDFTNSNHCKQHVKDKVTIRGSEYCGLAVLQAKSIEEVNAASHNLIFENGEKLSICIKSTPMTSLQMHSDLLYSHGIVVGEPNTFMRIIAKSLCKKSKYLNDPNPKEINWNGDLISRDLFQV